MVHVSKRYWPLFLIAVGMALHSAVVGRVLGSSIFMLLFFWGWVGACALRGRLDSAQTMAVSMIVLLVSIAVATTFMSLQLENKVAFFTFALYPALVSWVCVFIYVRHLQRKDGEAHAAALGTPQEHTA